MIETTFASCLDLITDRIVSLLIAQFQATREDDLVWCRVTTMCQAHVCPETPRGRAEQLLDRGDDSSETRTDCLSSLGGHSTLDNRTSNRSGTSKQDAPSLRVQLATWNSVQGHNRFLSTRHNFSLISHSIRNAHVSTNNPVQPLFVDQSLDFSVLVSDCLTHMIMIHRAAVIR